jgi:predicted deacetylase
VTLGRRLLADIELEPRGFVAPGYAYTRALRTTLTDSFEWFADLRGVHTRTGGLHSPALCLGSSTPLKRRLSPRFVSRLARSCGELMRIDVHPADFDLPSHLQTLEALIERAAGREPITYDELV